MLASVNQPPQLNLKSIDVSVKLNKFAYPPPARKATIFPCVSRAIFDRENCIVHILRSVLSRQRTKIFSNRLIAKKLVIEWRSAFLM
jgi:hypothetical protein